MGASIGDASNVTTNKTFYLFLRLHVQDCNDVLCTVEMFRHKEIYVNNIIIYLFILFLKICSINIIYFFI